MDLHATESAASRYRRFYANLQTLSTSPDPKHKALVDRANEELLSLKLLTPGAVHQNATLSNISIQYANEEYIGEQLMPVVSASKMSDIYYIYDKRNRLAAPDDAMGARSSANEVIETRSTATFSCKPYGLKNYVDALTLANQDAPLNEMMDLVQSVADHMALKREQRIATILTTGSNYGSNTAAIAAGSRWDTAGGGNPIKDIQDAISNIWSGRGPSDLVGFSTDDAWKVLSRHPMILDLFKYGGTAPGLATPSMFAGFFGLSKLLIGRARQDTANDGAAASYSRVWGTSNFGILRVARSPSIRNAAFGYTFRFGPVGTDEWFDPSLGTKGGYYARVSTHEDHKVVASDTGYLITTVIG